VGVGRCGAFDLSGHQTLKLTGAWGPGPRCLRVSGMLGLSEVEARANVADAIANLPQKLLIFEIHA